MNGSTVIGICTFRRASVVDTLSSLARMVPSAQQIDIVVADNDDQPSAASRIATVADTHPLPVHYLHAPANNISVARNAILDAARTAEVRFLAFLDDDETVSPGWLAALQAQQSRTGATAVLGPVRAVYGPGAPEWMRRGGVHDTRPEMGPDGTVRQGYTCNVLIDLTAPATRNICFDPGRGRTGGEDTAFFRTLRAAGGTIAFAPDAVALEAVPVERADLRWLMRRRYRMGQTHASLITEGRGAFGRLAALPPAVAKTAACLGIAGLNLFNRLDRNRALMRAALHIGAIAELSGRQRIEIYGTPTQAAK